MLACEPVRSGRVVHRFVLGRRLQGAAHKRDAGAVMQAVATENAKHGDLVTVDAIDGAGVDTACACGEKQHQWMLLALQTWPSAKFIGKTEDDTCGAAL